MSAPVVSVVIASVNGLPAIAECLDALTRQEGGVSAEILVADRCGEAVRAVLRARFPQVTLIAMAADTSIPALRAAAMARARGRLVAILEDHCNADPRWLLTLARCAAEGHVVIGGSVENGAALRAVDWAAFLCEYARFMPPLARGPAAEITGNNSAYDRRLLERLGGELQAEVWESFLHRRLRELGAPFHCEPELRVLHKKEFGFFYFISQRYHYSRSFAGMRLAGAPALKRLAYAAATPLLPPLLLARLVAVLARKRGYWGRFTRALPALLVFLPAWAWGEALGALGGPGDSLRRVE